MAQQQLRELKIPTCDDLRGRTSVGLLARILVYNLDHVYLPFYLDGFGVKTVHGTHRNLRGAPWTVYGHKPSMGQVETVKPSMEPT